MSAAAAAAAKEEEPPPRLFTFPSHQSHMLNLAKMCKENKEFTDCVIHCVSTTAAQQAASSSSSSPPPSTQLRAHRLVLGSASKFLRRVFDETPSSSLSESTLVVPGVRPSVVEALLDFLYSGEMRVRRADTADLQLLIETLQIDPELISVDEDDEGVEKAEDKGEEVHSKDKKAVEAKEAEKEKGGDDAKEQEDDNGEREDVEEGEKKTDRDGGGGTSSVAPVGRKRKASGTGEAEKEPKVGAKKAK